MSNGKASSGPTNATCAERPLLEVTGLEVVYNRNALAVQGIDVSVARGGFTAILGTNGAGKTTCLRAIAGFLEGDDVEVTAGEIRFDDTSIVGGRPDVVAGHGIRMVPEREKVFETMSVWDNLHLRGVAEGSYDVDDVFSYFPVLAERRQQLAGYLSGGERQMLAIGAALLGNPRLLLVDELSLGLAPTLVTEQMQLLRRLCDELGIAVLLVEQNVAAALEVADHGYVLENGRVVFDGTARELRASEDVREFYLGGADGHDYRDVKQYRRKRRWFG